MDPLRVMIGVDGSDHALRACRQATSLLRPAPEVTLVVVLSFELDPLTLLGEEVEGTPGIELGMKEAVALATDEPSRILEEAGCRVEIRHRFGNPADELLAQADEDEPDLIVVGRRGLGAPSRWLMGSVSERVLRHARHAVLVVP